MLSHNLYTVLHIPHDPVALEEHFRDDDDGPVSSQGYMPYLNKYILDKVGNAPPLGPQYLAFYSSCPLPLLSTLPSSCLHLHSPPQSPAPHCPSSALASAPPPPANPPNLHPAHLICHPLCRFSSAVLPPRLPLLSLPWPRTSFTVAREIRGTKWRHW